MATPRLSSATPVGVFVGIVDILIYQHFVPPVADIRTAQPFNADIENAERKALFFGTAFTLVVAGFMKSLEVFAIGGLVLVGMDFAIKHANAVHPDTGKMASSPSTDIGNQMSFPMPDYATEAA